MIIGVNDWKTPYRRYRGSEIPSSDRLMFKSPWFEQLTKNNVYCGMIHLSIYICDITSGRY